jgi:ABC-2 type transport system ATP-binding protein
MLEVRELSKRFGANQAVSNVSFQVHPGDAFGLLGPNGAGKSTTISMITGLINPDVGDVQLNGQSLRRNPKYVKQRIGLVPQSIALYENLNAKENLEFWGTVYGLSGQQLKDNLNWALEVAGLTHHARQAVKDFSGGMKRRLNIAVGMVHRPEILIMDEPTVGIDPQSRNHILDTVRHLNQTGMTVIYTSHYMEEVQFLCKRMAIMDHGQMIAYGTLDQVRQLAGSMATITIDVSGDFEPVIQALSLDPALAALHEEQGSLVLQSRDAASAVSKVVLALAEHQLQPTRIDVQEPNLETAFLHLTGRQLRDKEEGVGA